MGREIMRSVAAPPSAAETAALRDEIGQAAKRWREVQSAIAAAAAPDTDALRDGFRVAAWSGDWSTLIGAWRAWIGAHVAAHNLDGERHQLAVTLCIRPGPAPSFQRWEPGDLQMGTAISELPSFNGELERALRAVPPPPTGKGR